MRFRISELRELIREAHSKAYEILGIGPGASPEEIKSAYRKKAIELHPDRNPGIDTSQRMKMLNVAFGLLSDAERRRQYNIVGDKTLGDHASSGFVPPQKPASKPWEPPPPPPGGWAADYRANYDKKKAAPPPPPPPRKGPTPNPSSNKDNGFYADHRYFTKKEGTSNKFWQIERNGTDVSVRFGRIGSLGHRSNKSFPDEYSAIKFVRTMIRQKMDRGYRESASPFASRPQPKPAPKAAPKAAPKDSQYAEREARRRREQQRKKAAASPPGSSGKDTYKIYGKRGQAPASTRYKSKVYVAPKDTKFRNGDRANVGLGTDGRLSVHNPKTGHTQSWYSESIDRWLEDLLVEQHEN